MCNGSGETAPKLQPVRVEITRELNETFQPRSTKPAPYLLLRKLQEDD
jgi:hypothetical protein